MKNRKRLISILGATCMVGTVLAGCSGKEAAKDSPETATSSEGRAMEGNLYLEGLPIVKEKETYKIAALKHPMDTGKFADKHAVKKTEEATNIAIEWLEIPSTNFGEKVNIMFASGDTPDMIIGGLSTQQVVQNRDSLVKIDEYLEKYAPNINAMYNKHTEIKKELTHTDGHIYSFMTNSAIQPTNDTAGIMWYNKEWVKKLNLEIPSTTDEFYKFLKAMKEGDPNGNGKADEIPLTSNENFWSTRFVQLTGPWGIQNTLGPRVDNGVVSLDAATDKFYEVLKYYSKLAKEGLYDAEAFGQTLEQMRAKGNEGSLGVFTAWMASEVVGETLNDQYDYFKVPLKGADGTQMWHGRQDTPAGWKEGAVITSTAKSPETMMRWMDYINSSFEIKKEWQHGERGKMWDVDEATGKWWNFGVEEMAQKGYTPPEGDKWTVAYGDHAPVFLTAEEITLEDTEKIDPVGRLRIETVNAMRPFFQPADTFFPRVYEEPEVIEQRALIEAELVPYLQNFIAKSIVNGITDADWKAHLETLKKLKMDEYVASYQAKYDAGKK